jgi:hypothetical protein
LIIGYLFKREKRWYYQPSNKSTLRGNNFYDLLPEVTAEIGNLRIIDRHIIQQELRMRTESIYQYTFGRAASYIYPNGKRTGAYAGGSLLWKGSPQLYLVAWGLDSSGKCIKVKNGVNQLSKINGYYSDTIYLDVDLAQCHSILYLFYRKDDKPLRDGCFNM